jgi:hypothetical protein
VTSTANAGRFKNRFTMVFQMLLCGECYENVYLKANKLSIVQRLVYLYIIYISRSDCYFLEKKHELCLTSERLYYTLVRFN